MSLARIGSIVLVSLVSYLIYFGLKFVGLYKISINKWIVFTGALIILISSTFFGGSFTSIYSYILSGIFVILLLWFLDLNDANNKKTKKNDIVIKPKKKPNRIANEKKKK